MILVTGASGFIGSHLVEELVKRGEDVRAFVHYNSRDILGNLKFIPSSLREKIEIFAGDLTFLDEAMDAVNGVESVVHLAARISVNYSYKAAIETIESNMKMLANVLEACKRLNVNNVVYVSSSEVYGTPQEVPITLNTPKHAQSPYAASKIATDEIARSFALSFNLSVKIARPFNTFGERQSVRAVIPWIVYQLLSKDRDVVKIGNIHTRRDFVYVKDTVRFLIRMLEDKRDFLEVNFPTGVPYSIEEVVNVAKKVLGIEKKVQIDKKRIRPEKSEVKLLTGDVNETYRLIGIKPEVSLEEGIKNLANWMRENLDNIQKELSLL